MRRVGRYVVLLGLDRTYETCDEVVVICRHHADLLRLFENGLDLLRGAVQHDVDLPGLLHIFE